MLEGKSLPERYVERSTNILLRLKQIPGLSPHVSRQVRGVGNPHDFFLVFEADESGAAYHLPCSGGLVEVGHINPAEIRRGERWNKQTMLVGDIEEMESIKIVVPSRVWLYVADCLDDLWAGELYLSTRNHLFQTIRALSEGELNLVGVGVERRQNVENGEVKCASKIVNSVADDKRKFLGNGFVLFESYGGLAGFKVSHENESARLLLKELGYLPIEIADVMLGPFKFKNGASEGLCHA